MGYHKKKEVVLTQREIDNAVARSQHVLDVYAPDTPEYKRLYETIIENALKEKEERIRRNRNNRQRGKALEKKLRDDLGLERVPYSGSNSEFGFGDVRGQYVLGEAKTIEHKGTQKNIIVLKKDFDDIVKRAHQENKIPWYAYRAPRHSQVYIVMTVADWKLIMTSAGLIDGEDKLMVVDGKLTVNGIPYQQYLENRGDSEP